MSQNNAATQPVMNEVESRAPTRLLPAVQKKLSLPPIYGAGPNNAEVDDVDYAELGSSVPLPPHSQTKRRRLLLGTSSLTRYLKSLGAIKNADSAEPAHSTYDNGHHGQAIKGAPVQNQSSGPLSRPFHIRLDLDNYSYSRDAVGANPNLKSGTNYYENHRTSSPDEYRRSTSSSTRQYLNRVPEEMESSPSDADVQGHQSTNVDHGNDSNGAHRYYGSVGYGSAAPTTLSAGARQAREARLDQDEEDSDLNEDEEEWLLDEELARDGLYRGNYKNLIALYTLVPFSTILTFVFLALLPILAFRSSAPSLFPYPPYLPFPVPELLTSTALWALSYLLRDFLYATSLSGVSLVPASSHRFPTLIPILTSILSALLQSASSLFFRQLAIPILLIPHYSTEHIDLGAHTFEGPLADLHKRHFPTWQDDAFRRAWWVALGWAAAEAVVGIKQGYESIALYKDVLVTATKDPASKVEVMAQRSDEEDQGARAASHTPVANFRAVTPTQSNDVEENSSVTPTQGDRHSSFIGNSNVQNSATASRPIKRTHSDSLSSVTSDSHSPYGDHRLVDVAYSEREPLLKVDGHSGLLNGHLVNGGSRLSVEDEVARDLDQLLACKSREELEEVYGIPVIRIPVFISCLHRINSILSSLGICLLLTAAYMRSTFAYSHPSPGDPVSFFPSTDQHPPSNRPLAYTILPILLVQALMSMIHTPWILPRIGIHTFVYVGLLISLGLFFGGLGVWEVLT